jgi:hypothetical protein
VGKGSRYRPNEQTTAWEGERERERERERESNENDLRKEKKIEEERRGMDNRCWPLQGHMCVCACVCAPGSSGYDVEYPLYGGVNVLTDDGSTLLIHNLLLLKGVVMIP